MIVTMFEVIRWAATQHNVNVIATSLAEGAGMLVVRRPAPPFQGKSEWLKYD